VTKPNPRNPTNVVTLLKRDHAEVKALFEEFASETRQSNKSEIANRICNALTVHATCEEEIVYPAAREALDDDDMIDEAEQEHAAAKDLIAEIETMDVDDGAFDATVTALKECIEHHVAEEEGDMFPKLQATKLDLDELGSRVATRKVNY